MIFFDIDGVWCDFPTGFTHLANKMFGTPISGPGARTEWGYHDILTNKQLDEVWAEIHDSNNFWFNLPPLFTVADINALDRLTDGKRAITAITNRRENDNVRSQSEGWFAKNGIKATIVFTEHKELEIGVSSSSRNYLLEDSPKNLMAWENMWGYSSGQQYANLVCRDWPYNRNMSGPDKEGKNRGFHPIRVSSIEEYITFIEKNNKLAKDLYDLITIHS